MLVPPQRFSDSTAEVLPTKGLQMTEVPRRLFSVDDIPYSPTSLTVPSNKRYRTPRQALPYRPARDTVLPDKPYRTAAQNIAYSPTRAARKVPAKRGLIVGKRSERPVIVSC